MAIPTPYAIYSVALHRLVTRYGILDDAGKKCAVVWYTRNKRWPIVEYICRVSRPLLDRLLKRFVLLPVINKVFLVLECLTPSAFGELHACSSF